MFEIRDKLNITKFLLLVFHIFFSDVSKEF